MFRGELRICTEQDGYRTENLGTQRRILTNAREMLVVASGGAGREPSGHRAVVEQHRDRFELLRPHTRGLGDT